MRRFEEDVENLEKEIRDLLSGFQYKLNKVDKSIAAIIIEKIVEGLLIRTELNVVIKLQNVCYDNEIYFNSTIYRDNDKTNYFRIDLANTISFKIIQFLIALSKEEK